MWGVVGCGGVWCGGFPLGSMTTPRPSPPPPPPLPPLCSLCPTCHSKVEVEIRIKTSTFLVDRLYSSTFVRDSADDSHDLILAVVSHGSQVP